MEGAQFFKRLAAFPEEMRSEPSLKDDQMLQRCGKVWPIQGIKRWQWQCKGKMKKEERQELGHQGTKGEWSWRRGDRDSTLKTVTVRTEMRPLGANKTSARVSFSQLLQVDEMEMASVH